MTVQPTLFDTVPTPIRARCWRCRKVTDHRLLSAYRSGHRMVSCVDCRCGSTLGPAL